MGNKSLKRNASGYSDPTAYEAILKVDKINNEKISNILEDIFEVCKEHGVYIYGSVSFVDRYTGNKAKRYLYYKSFKKED